MVWSVEAKRKHLLSRYVKRTLANPYLLGLIRQDIGHRFGHRIDTKKKGRKRIDFIIYELEQIYSDALSSKSSHELLTLRQDHVQGSCIFYDFLKRYLAPLTLFFFLGARDNDQYIMLETGLVKGWNWWNLNTVFRHTSELGFICI